MRSRTLRLAAIGAALVATCLPRSAVALNDPEYASKQWGTQLIGAQAAWDAGLTGQGVRIAVLDTGVHFGHFEFNGRLVAGPNYVDPAKPPQDDGHDTVYGEPQGHGTHVAGIAAAGIDQGGIVGVAPKATVVAVKVLDRDGIGETSKILTAVRWAADNGIEVVNLSLGGVGPQFFDDPETLSTVEYAWSKGSIVVFAAGNNYVFGTEYRNMPAIVVSATTRTDGKAHFSSTVANTKWALSAPGGAATLTSPTADGIFSTAWDSDTENNTYRYLQGTSQAAPHVAGAAAVLRAAGLTPLQTVERLLATAKDLGPTGRDDTFGSGRLDVAKAVAGLSAPGSPATTAPASGETPTTAAPTATSSPSSPAPGSGSTTTAPRRPTATAPPGAAPAPTDTIATQPPPTDTTDTTANQPLTALEAPPDPGTDDADLESADTTKGGRAAAPDDDEDDGSPAPLVALAGVAAAGTAGWALWLVWRRRTEASH